MVDAFAHSQSRVVNSRADGSHGAAGYLRDLGVAQVVAITKQEYLPVYVLSSVADQPLQISEGVRAELIEEPSERALVARLAPEYEQVQAQDIAVERAVGGGYHRRPRI